MEIITRAEAIERGLPRYITGKPCKHGHIAERFVSSRNCCECSYSRVKTSRDLQPEKWRNYAAASYDANREKELERWRRYSAREREAIRARGRKRYQADAESLRAAVALYRASNPEKVQSQAARYRRANAVKLRERTNLWRAENREMVAANNLKRRAMRMDRTPPWFGELDAFIWKEAAHLARLREASTGFKWQADHMIPLAARDVSGLHTWNNCQVIPASLNQLKNNRLIFTEPCEWLLSC